SGNASSVLLNADLREIVVTDTIPIADDMKEAVRVISVAEMFGDAIVRIHEGRSISTMFR
ncbi:MAG: phosphoribosylpyrophosphate synthetase, partial [Bacillota bacterium]